MRKFIVLIYISLILINCKDKANISKIKIKDSSVYDHKNKDRLIKSDKIYVQTDSLLRVIKNDKKKQEVLFKLANLYLNEGDTILGLKKLEQALKLNPKHIPCLLRLSIIYAEKAQSRCLTLSQRVINQANDRQNKAQAWFIRGIYYKEQARLNPKSNNLQLALNSWDSTIVSDWTFIDAYLEKAVLYFNIHNFRQAKKTLQLAYRINHHNPEIYYWLGRMAEQENNINKALEHYQNSLILDKNFQASRIRFDSIQKNYKQ